MYCARFMLLPVADDFEESAEKAERVSRLLSWVVAAVSGPGTGELEEKPTMAQRTMHSSWRAFDKMRSLCH